MGDQPQPDVILGRSDREVATLLAKGYDPKQIAANIEVALSTAYLMINSMCARAKVAGRYALLIWILQHPACLFAGVASCPGLHVQPCPCGSPYCLGMIVAQLPPVTFNDSERDMILAGLALLAVQRPELDGDLERITTRFMIPPIAPSTLIPAA